MKKIAASNCIVVGGMTSLTTIDYPGELATVIFLQGCPWRCGYCQNSDLLTKKSNHLIPWKEVIQFLEKRKGLLDAVVFSGGEPTMQAGLQTAILQVKSMGFKIGLHSAGVYPDRLKKILPLIDWIGLDIKAAESDYELITKNKASGKRAWQSAQLVIDSGTEYEFRTTFHEGMLNRKKLDKLASELAEIGAKNYVVQKCINKNCFDSSLKGVKTNNIDFEFINECESTFSKFQVRSS